ncbi:MAG: hypothetical protein QW353_00750 [Candidatus Korarchaeum sp.]
MLEGSLIVKVKLLLEPELGTLPVPTHPVQVYLDPPFNTGELTLAVISVPFSNHPLEGVGVS